ncbi:MAG: hypothetical protein HC831_21200 [Chloroflexia bacterium]|nr:hypothetical protein [Chloroflexia bacterium]
MILFLKKFLLYEGGKYNTLEGTYVDASGDTYYGTITKDELTNEVAIAFDITDYIQSEIADSYYDTERMFILSYDSPDYNASINQVAIGGYENKKYQPKLNIYYIHYETY